MAILSYGQVGWRSASIPSTSSLSANLYAVYKAESNANDSLGLYNGTAYGGLTYTSGKSGNAFSFNGTNSYILLPQNSMRFTNSFSVSMWTYTTANQSALKGLFGDYYYGTSDHGYTFGVTNTNKVQVFALGTGSVGVGFNSTLTLSNNQWNHIVILWDKVNTTWKLYINNVLSDTYTNAAASSILYAVGSNRTNIGAINSSPSGVGSVFNGLIDEVYVYTGVLSPSSVSSLYNSGTGKFYPTF